MSDSVCITAIVCVTILALCWVLFGRKEGKH